MAGYQTTDITGSLTSDGTSSGIAALASTAGLVVGAICVLRADDQDPVECIITTLTDTQVGLRFVGAAGNGNSNISAYTTGQNATLRQRVQTVYGSRHIFGELIAKDLSTKDGTWSVSAAGDTDMDGDLLAKSLGTQTATFGVTEAGDLSATSLSNKTGTWNVDIHGKMTMASTETATIGAVTINKPAGVVIVASGQSSVVVTNSLASATCIPYVVLLDATDDVEIKAVVRASGHFTIHLTDVTTGDRKVGFVIFN